MDARKVNEMCELYCGNEMRKLIKICRHIVNKYGDRSSSNFDEFLSLANELVLKIAINFDEEKNDNFDIFLRDCLNRRYTTEFKRNPNAKKRIPERCIDSIDRPVSDEDDITLGELLRSDFVIEDYIEELADTKRTDAYIESLTPKQRKIAELVMEGYTLNDAKRILNMSDVKFNSCLSRMRTFDKRVLIRL